MAIFNSYVKLPEGMFTKLGGRPNFRQGSKERRTIHQNLDANLASRYDQIWVEFFFVVGSNTRNGYPPVNIEKTMPATASHGQPWPLK